MIDENISVFFYLNFKNLHRVAQNYEKYPLVYILKDFFIRLIVNNAL